MIYQGDNWKQCTASVLLEPKLTRAQAQAKCDDLYARGRMTLGDYRTTSNIIGEPTELDFRLLFDLRSL